VRSASYLVKLVARWAVLTLSISTLLFVAAGTTRLPSLRNYLATFSTFLLATMLGVDPGLAKERSCMSEKGRTPAGRFAAGLSSLTTLTVAALHVGHFHWLHSVPADARRGSLVVFAGAMALQMWAMVANPFFSPDIRLQPERGHRLIACGPYRLLRHPGYLAMLVAVPASALAIGSWLALLPAAAFCLVIWKRVRVEEEFLQKNLAGYSEYMGRVRGRSFPAWIRAAQAETRFPARSRLKTPTGGGRESARIFHSCSLPRTRQKRFLSLLFRPALLQARQAVNFSCALAARRSSASAARPSGFPVSSQKDRLCRTAFPAPPENAELGLGSRRHLPRGAPRQSRAEKGDSNHLSEPHFPHRLRRQRRTTEIHEERHPGRNTQRRNQSLVEKLEGRLRLAPSGIAAPPGANLPNLPASWRKAHTFRSRANCAIASTKKTAGVMPKQRPSNGGWLRFTPTAS
jgi:protein-S-isoprenylcysteine O-methyltransferase Ste14